MDKSNLYYIVVLGTNNRAQTEMNEPLIVRGDHIDDVMGPLVDGFECITIEEFEKVFAEEVITVEEFGKVFADVENW